MPQFSIGEQRELNDFTKLRWFALVPKNCAWITFYAEFDYGGLIVAVGGRVVPILGVTRTPGGLYTPKNVKKQQKKRRNQSGTRTLYPLMLTQLIKPLHY